MNTYQTCRFFLSIFTIVAASTASGADWYGTMSCGNPQKSQDKKLREPFASPVFLSINKNNAKLERIWKKGEERQEGEFSYGQTLHLTGQGILHDRGASPWRTTTTLIENGRRFEGTAVIESLDGKMTYHHCTVVVESTLPVAAAATENPQSKNTPESLPQKVESSIGKNIQIDGGKPREKFPPQALVERIGKSVAGPHIETPTTVADASKKEKSESFYEISNVLIDQPPGTMLRITDYKTSRWTGTDNSRIIYVSVDANGQTVATTAAVAIPKGMPPREGWPVIAWAHGTVGIGKTCAPSMTDNLSKYGPYFQSLTDRGYAIVATDYSGLGTTGRHFYSHRESNARDVIESVRAATEAYPVLSKSFVVVGHSQGGLAAIGVAETIDTLSVAPLKYKGAIAIAPGTGLVYEYFNITEKHGSSDPTSMAYMLMYTATLKLAAPGLKYTDQISSDVAELMPAAETQCLDELRATLKASVRFKKYFVESSWLQNSALKNYSKSNEAGRRKAIEPLFIVWGTNDTSISKRSLEDFIRSSCKYGSNIQFNQYSGADHISVLGRAKPDMVIWIDQQFSGTYKAAECGEEFKTR